MYNHNKTQNWLWISKLNKKNINFSKSQYFSKNSKFSKNYFFFKKFKFSEKSKFSKCHIPSTAFFIYEIAFFTTKVGSLVIIVLLKVESFGLFYNYPVFVKKIK